MLYDILIIDDEFKLLEEKSDDGNIVIPRTLLSLEDGITALGLYFHFLKERLRVTYTTGLEGDLKRLEREDLSEIQYIFCDLVFEEIPMPNMTHKNINSNVMGILKEILAKAKPLNQNDIELYVFSGHVAESIYGDEGVEHLSNSINSSKSTERIKLVEPYIDKQKSWIKEITDKLTKYNIHRYQRNAVIGKTIEIENRICEKAKHEAKCDIKKYRSKECTPQKCNAEKCCKRSFSQKIGLLEDEYKGKETELLNKKLHLLREIRNHLAHKEKDESICKCIKERFNKIYGNKIEMPDNLKKFKDLMDYIEEAHKLAEGIEDLEPK